MMLLNGAQRSRRENDGLRKPREAEDDDQEKRIRGHVSRPATSDSRDGRSRRSERKAFVRKESRTCGGCGNKGRLRGSRREAELRDVNETGEQVGPEGWTRSKTEQEQICWREVDLVSDDSGGRSSRESAIRPSWRLGRSAAGRVGSKGWFRSSSQGGFPTGCGHSRPARRRPRARVQLLITNKAPGAHG